jgi:hypothetical protein
VKEKEIGVMLYIPPRPNQILCLDLAGSDLAILGALFNVLNQLLLLVFQLDSFPV